MLAFIKGLFKRKCKHESYVIKFNNWEDNCFICECDYCGEEFAIGMEAIQ